MPVALLLVACAIFGAWMHRAILDPANIGWLLDGNDRGQNSLGLLAYLRGDAHWPSLHDSLLMAPEGIGVPLTDSNPLLALLLKPVAPWLPVGWQYTGWWLFACIIMQVGFAFALVRTRLGNEIAALFGATMLALSPALLNRAGHMNLCAHWVILWALWIYVDARRQASLRHWLAVLAVTALIHPYLLVMVAAIWASAQVRLLAIGSVPRWRTLGGSVAVSVAIAGLLVLLGFVAEPIVSTGTYGLFTMAIDAPWNPGRAGFSAFLPAHATGWWQAFEGFNYLGAGTLALIGMAAALALRRSRAERPPADMPSLLWLVPALTVLTAIAIGPKLAFGGGFVAEFAAPRWLVDLLDPVRASGRLFWPVGYTVAFWAIGRVGRTAWATPLLGLALVVQVMDLRPMLREMRGGTANAEDRTTFRRTRDPRWNGLIASARQIAFQPAEPYRDLALMEEVAWRAITAPRPVPMRYFYASREPRAVRARLDADARGFADGRLEPATLYILLDASPPPMVAARVETIDGVRVIPPAP